MGVKPIPEGYHTLTAAFAVDDAAAAIDFYKNAFGAKERMRMEAPGGKIAHAELEIGDSVIMLSDPFPQSNVKPPNEVGTSTMSIFMFWGDRFGTITDPYGHQWSISTHVEDVPPDEMAKRGEAAMAEMMS